MKKLLFSGLCVLLISSCGSLNQFVVTPVGKEPAQFAERFIYSLPRTVLEVKVECTKRIYIPGPYKQFAEKFLGISNYIREEKTQWEIGRVDISGYSEPDPLRFYSVNLLKGSWDAESYFNVTAKGLIIDPMGMLSASSLIPEKQQLDIPVVLDLSMKKNHKEKVDTLFKTVITDSSFVKIPILRKQKEAKTLEQKAEEASNLIIKIRKRRLKLVTGEYTVFPEGIALKTALEELDRTESEYIALFTGKIYTEKYTRSSFIVPSGVSEKIEFLRFSPSKGIISLESAEGKPVSIEITPENVTIPEVDGSAEGSKNTLFFRAPLNSFVRVTSSGDLLYDGRISIFQAGMILSLPVSGKK
jgi:hypothetical protein